MVHVKKTICSNHLLVRALKAQIPVYFTPFSHAHMKNTVKESKTLRCKIILLTKFPCAGVHITYLGNVSLRGQADHDVQFLQFHVDWVVVLDKEHFDLLLQDLRPAHKQHVTH